MSSVFCGHGLLWVWYLLGCSIYVSWTDPCHALFIAPSISDICTTITSICWGLKTRGLLGAWISVWRSPAQFARDAFHVLLLTINAWSGRDHIRLNPELHLWRCLLLSWLLHLSCFHTCCCQWLRDFCKKKMRLAFVWGSLCSQNVWKD